MAGITHTPVAGQFICGDGTLCGQWYTGWEKPQLVLDAKTYNPVYIPEGDTVLGFFKPRLVLLGRPLATVIQAQVSVGRPLLLLTGKGFAIQPYITLIHQKGTLILRGKVVVLNASTSPAVGRPLLILTGKPILRAGKPGLIPTIPESIILVPTVPDERPLLVPTTPETELLVPTSPRDV